MEKQLVSHLMLIAEASGKTFDSTYSKFLNGNMMTLCESDRQIKFTQFGDKKESDRLAKTIIDILSGFGYRANLISTEETNDNIYEYIISF